MEHDTDKLSEKSKEERRLVYTPIDAEDEALYQMIMEGLNSGPGEVIDLDRFLEELDARITGKN